MAIKDDISKSAYATYQKRLADQKAKTASAIVANKPTAKSGYTVSERAAIGPTNAQIAKAKATPPTTPVIPKTTIPKQSTSSTQSDWYVSASPWMEPWGTNPNYVAANYEQLQQMLDLPGIDEQTKKKWTALYKERETGMNLGAKDMPGNINAVVERGLGELEEDKSELDKQLAYASKEAERKLSESKGAVKASFAQDKEGVVSAGNQMAAGKITGVMEESTQQALNQIEAQKRQLDRMVQQQKDNYSESMAQSIQALGAQVAQSEADLIAKETARRQQSMDLLEVMKADNGLAGLDAAAMSQLESILPGLPSGVLDFLSNTATRNVLSEEQTARFDKQMQVLGTVKEMVGAGMEISPDMAVNFAQQTGLPAESIWAYNTKAQQINADSKLDSATKMAELQKLGYELDREARGITTQQLQNIDYLKKLYQAGASQAEIATVKNAMGIKDMDDPMYRAQYQKTLLDSQLVAVGLQYLPYEKQLDLQKGNQDLRIGAYDEVIQAAQAAGAMQTELLTLEQLKLDARKTELEIADLAGEAPYKAKVRELELQQMGLANQALEIGLDFLPEERRLAIQMGHSKMELDDYDAMIKGLQFEADDKMAVAQIEKMKAETAKLQNEIETYSQTSGVYMPLKPIAGITATVDNGVLNISTPKDMRIQCGAFVNRVWGMPAGSAGGFADSYDDKKKIVDKRGIRTENIVNALTEIKPGMAFVMPIGGKYAVNGHVGFVKNVNEDGTITTIEANGDGNLKVSQKTRPISQIYGFAYPPAGAAKEIGVEDVEKPLDSKDVTALRKEVYQLPSVKMIGDVVNQYDKMQSAYDAYKAGTVGAGSTDQALAVMFQKMLDPGSVVREGEFDRTASGQSVLVMADSYLKKLQAGGIGINDETRKDMIDIAKEFAEVEKARFRRETKFYVEEAERGGVDVERILGSYYNYYEDTPSGDFGATPVGVKSSAAQSTAVDGILTKYGLSTAGSLLNQYNISY